MINIILTVGLPGSGKSTWAREQVLANPGKWKRANKDDLRAMLDADQWSKSNEKFVLSIRDEIVTRCLNRDVNIIIDDTNLNSDHFKTMVHLARASNRDVFVSEMFFPCEVEECVRRDALRPKPVGRDVIERMAKQFPRALSGKPRCETIVGTPAQTPVYAPAETLEKAIICDLDGTLAIITGRSPYDASTCEQDALCVPVANTIKNFYEKGYKIIFCSGREDKYRTPSENFIKNHLPNIKYELFMRKTGDQRKDSLIKREIFETNIRNSYNVEFVLDDRPTVIRMWRYELGLTVFALNDKEF